MCLCALFPFGAVLPRCSSPVYLHAYLSLSQHAKKPGLWGLNWGQAKCSCPSSCGWLDCLTYAQKPKNQTSPVLFLANGWYRINRSVVFKMWLHRQICDWCCVSHMYTCFHTSGLLSISLLFALVLSTWFQCSHIVDSAVVLHQLLFGPKLKVKLGWIVVKMNANYW